MRNLLFIAIIIAFSSCSKTTKNAVVVKDCTGTYIRMSNVDYLVCNGNILGDYKDNDLINVSFTEINKCIDLEGKTVCELYHPYKSLVRIQSIN